MHSHAGSRISFDIPPGFQGAAGTGNVILGGHGLLVSMGLVSPGTVPVLALLASQGRDELRSQLQTGGMSEGEIESTLHATEQLLRETDVEAVPVAFGSVAGCKYVYRSKLPARPPVIHFALDVPGGHVHVTVTLLAASDYSAIESALHTVAVTSE